MPELNVDAAWSWSLLIGLLMTQVVGADSDEAPPTVASRVPNLETGFEGDHLTGDWGGVRTRLVDRGLHLGVGYTAEWMANLSGGLKRGSVYQGLLETSLDLDLERARVWRGGVVHVSALYPHGNSLSRAHVGDLSTVSSIDAQDSVRLFELWYEHRWEGLSLRIGQLAADEDFAISEYGADLVNGSFGFPQFLSANVPASAYPIATPGVMLHWHFADQFYAQAGVYDGDPGSESVNQHGTTWRWNEDEGVLALVELGRERPAEEPFSGIYKLGAWFHSGSFDHQRRDQGGLSLADPLSSGLPRRLNNDWGVYLAADQAIWNESDTDQGLGLFVRLAGARSDRNFVQYYVDGGLRYTGLIAGRDRDVAAAGVLWQRLGEDARRLSRDLNTFNGTNSAALDYELGLEVTYQFRVGAWWTVQPDVQVLFHPGGSGQLDTAVVAGVRSSIVF